MDNPSQYKVLDLEHLQPRKEKHRATSLAYYRSHKEVCHARSKSWREENPERQMWLQAKHHALKLGVPFSIDVADITIPKMCPILNIPLVQFGDRDKAPSLDRIIGEFGYVVGNIQVISGSANRIKSDATLEELTKITEHLKCLKSRR